MNRRSLLAGIFVAGFAPAAVSSSILMPSRAIKYASGGIVVPYGTNIEIAQPSFPYDDGTTWLNFKDGCVYVRRIGRWEPISLDVDSIRSAEFRTIFHA
jgi:hypothetical protein